MTSLTVLDFWRLAGVFRGLWTLDARRTRSPVPRWQLPPLLLKDRRDLRMQRFKESESVQQPWALFRSFLERSCRPSAKPPASLSPTARRSSALSFVSNSIVRVYGVAGFSDVSPRGNSGLCDTSSMARVCAAAARFLTSWRPRARCERAAGQELCAQLQNRACSRFLDVRELAMAGVGW